MKLALGITVKNERRLHHNLSYHHRLGVDHAYIFLDGTTDGTQRTMAMKPYIRILLIEKNIGDQPIRI